jgi:hypothetical protein
VGFAAGESRPALPPLPYPPTLSSRCYRRLFKLTAGTSFWQFAGANSSRPSIFHPSI